MAGSPAAMFTPIVTFNSQQRPHRGLDGRTPATAYAATPKATPADRHDHTAHYRLRYDRVAPDGKISFRRAGRMHHLGIGPCRKRVRAVADADEHTVTVIHLDTGEIIATNAIDPTRAYWRNTQREPGRWPGSRS